MKKWQLEVNLWENMSRKVVKQVKVPESCPLGCYYQSFNLNRHSLQQFQRAPRWAGSLVLETEAPAEASRSHLTSLSTLRGHGAIYCLLFCLLVTIWMATFCQLDTSLAIKLLADPHTHKTLQLRELGGVLGVFVRANKNVTHLHLSTVALRLRVCIQRCTLWC